MIKARRMREDFWSFQPTHKIFLASNYKPVVRGQDEGIWRRIHLVPFTVQFSPDQQDHDLTRRLLDELPGIAAWAVAGCLEWQERGLDPPAEVLQATKGYRSEMDQFAQWLDQVCEVGEGKSARACDLLASYRDFSGYRHTTPQWLGHRLAKRGFTKAKSGKIRWHGLRIRE